MIDAKAIDAFWSVVERCLVQFHGLSEDDAHRRGQALRARIESPPIGTSGEIFYHAEPFDVACDLADEQRDLSRYRQQYDAILNECRW